MEIGSSSSASQNLPWLWSIEALVDCDEVDTVLLDELSNNVPDFHDESWGGNPSERLALRHTEDLLRGLTTSAEATDVASTSIPHSNFHISVSEGAQDVLLRLRNQITTANLRMSELEFLKSAARQYIIQKRASLPKCALQQLKDESVDGNEISTIFLLQSGDVNRKHEDITNGKGAGPHLAAETVDQSTSTVAVHAFDMDSSLLSAENGNEVSGDCHGKTHLDAASDAARSIGHRVEDGKDHSVIDVSSSSGRANDAMEEDPQDATSLPSKWKSDICKKQNEASLDISNVPAASSEDHVDGKTNYRSVQCPPQRSLSSSINEVNESAQGAEFQDPQENGASAADDDDTQAYNSRIAADKEGKTPEGAQSDGSNQNDCAGLSSKPEALGCKEDNLDEPHPFVSDVDIANAAQKVAYLSSNNMSHRSDCPEQSLCVKCNKGGQLLVCCVSSCRIVVHESCVGSSGYCDDTGNFHCPFCSFAEATNAYREMKRKATLVREKAALARGRLLKFMCIVHAQQQEQLPEMMPTENLRQSNVVEHANVINESRDNRQLRKIIGKQSNLAMQHQLVEVDSGHINSSKVDKRAFISQILGQKTKVLPTRGEVIAVESHQDTTMLEDEGSPDNLSNSRNDLPQGEEDSNIIFKKIPVVLLNNEKLKTKLDAVQQFPIREKERKQGGPGDTAALVMENLNLEQNVCPAQELSSHQNLDPEDISASENEDCISYEFRRRRLPFDHYSNQASPNSKRKKIPWTTEEEEKLKEGVRKFGTTNGKSIPWKRILLFGEHIFQESRTTVDLKDKWRNIWSKEGRAALT